MYWLFLNNHVVINVNYIAVIPHIFMIISIPVFMVTLKWIQEFHLAFEPMGVYMNTICSNVPIPEECMSIWLVIRYVSGFVFFPEVIF